MIFLKPYPDVKPFKSEYKNDIPLSYEDARCPLKRKLELLSKTGRESDPRGRSKDSIAKGSSFRVYTHPKPSEEDPRDKKRSILRTTSFERIPVPFQDTPGDRYSKNYLRNLTDSTIIEESLTSIEKSFDNKSKTLSFNKVEKMEADVDAKDNTTLTTADDTLGVRQKKTVKAIKRTTSKTKKGDKPTCVVLRETTGDDVTNIENIGQQRSALRRSPTTDDDTPDERQKKKVKAIKKTTSKK